ncbi:polysaccharide deacetylase [Salinicoccus sediminis]|uniref:Carbohydrate deacetylase n=1 Tax=Salinicoccus sediminis TaxID=1432562 RepID=A0A0M2SGR0_9STAP|nr:chitin disaccharide deacetylase [Salinicoccus sediminis]KKK33894.1 polysaccharide deacetylase [Salinicoccus sediminis]
MKQIIINADDFGYSRAVNYGIIDAHTEGLLTSTTLMTNMPAAEHAFRLGHEHKSLGIGVHLTLTCGRPLLDTHHTLVDANGDFKSNSNYQGKFHIDPDELYDEWKAQIEKFLDSGLVPTHLDSHHHVNNLAPVLPVFKRLAMEYRLPVRNNFEAAVREFTTTGFFQYEPDVLLADNEEILETFGEAETVEIMCHPAYIDKALLAGSTYVMPRLEELDALTDARIIRKIAEDSRFQLITYGDLSKGV